MSHQEYMKEPVWAVESALALHDLLSTERPKPQAEGEAQ